MHTNLISIAVVNRSGIVCLMYLQISTRIRRDLSTIHKSAAQIVSKAHTKEKVGNVG